MPNDRNKNLVEKLTKRLADAKAVIFVDYKGLNVNAINKLRDEVSKEGADIQIAKNTLVQIALENNKMSSKQLENVFEGQTATVFNNEDAIAPLKKLYAFIKENELPIVKAGIVEGKILQASDIEALSSLPSKEELQAKVVGGLKSPLFGFVNVLGGSQRKLVYALAAVAEKKEV